MGPAEWLNSKSLLQTPGHRRNHIANHRLRPGNCSVLTVVGSILGGIAQNPLAAQVSVVALTSATWVIRRDIMPDIALTRKSLVVR